MKALLIADLHLHHLPQWRLDWGKQFLDEMISIIQDKQIQLVWLLGDVTEVRNKLDARILNPLLAFLMKLQEMDIEVIWICGQHDSYLPGRATLEGLDTNFTNIQIIADDIYINDRWHANFIPYQRKIADYKLLLDKATDAYPVFTHIPVLEAIPFSNDEHYISSKEFARFPSAWSGDIHKHNQFDNLTYIGSPMQRDYRDKGVDGQIAIWDGRQMEYIKVDHPRFIDVANQDELNSLPSKESYFVRSKERLHADDRENILGVAYAPAKDEAKIKELSAKIKSKTDDTAFINEAVKEMGLKDKDDEAEAIKLGLGCLQASSNV